MDASTQRYFDFNSTVFVVACVRFYWWGENSPGNGDTKELPHRSHSWIHWKKIHAKWTLRIHWMSHTSSSVIATIEWWRANTGEQCLLNTNYRKFHFKNAFTNSMCTYVSVHRKLSEVEFVRIRLQNDSNLTEFLEWSS